MSDLSPAEQKVQSLMDALATAVDEAKAEKRTAWDRWCDDDLKDLTVTTPTHCVRVTIDYELDLQVPPWRDLDEALGEVLSTLLDGDEYAYRMVEASWGPAEPELLMPSGRLIGAIGTIEAVAP